VLIINYFELSSVDDGLGLGKVKTSVDWIGFQRWTYEAGLPTHWSHFTEIQVAG